MRMCYRLNFSGGHCGAIQMQQTCFGITSSYLDDSLTIVSPQDPSVLGHLHFLLTMFDMSTLADGHVFIVCVPVLKYEVMLNVL